MARRKLQFPEGIVDCINATRSGGTILIAGNAADCNGMAIGWISIGSIWGRPSCTVLVRESRHTFGYMEKNGTFTVNVLDGGFAEAVNLFGTESGRDMDKFDATGLTKAAGVAVECPHIAEADYVIECRTAFKSPMDPALVSADYVKGCYGSGDYHTCYYGEIVAIHAE